VIRPLLACALLLAALVPANAGAGSRDSGYNRCVPFPCSGGGGSYTGPLDIVSGATFCGALRACSSAIAAAATQKLINIRNIATSETCDVIVATNGGFGNVANCSGSSSGLTPAAFCALSSSSCVITEIYDQSGNGFNATQSTAGSQPALVLSCINSLPYINFTTVSQSLAEAATISVAQPFTFFNVVNRTGSFTTNSYYMTGSLGGVYYTATSGFIGLNFNGFSGNIAISEPGFHSIATIINSTTSSVVIDGTANSASTGTGNLAQKLTLGIYSGDASGMIGKMTDAIVWPSGLSGANSTLICKNQQAYYGAGNFGAAC
jgi:hypothetical protein